MFNSLTWMFKQEDFKKHFLYLFSTLVIFISSAAFTFMIISSFVTNPLWKFVVYIVSAILFFCPFLCFSGYFWNLTDNIINRQTDVVSSNVYNGKVKEIYKIELPEIKTPRLIWRGIASVVASILLCYPFVILLTLAAVTSGAALAFYSFNIFTTIGMYIGFYIFISLFIPALLWNYAKQDSIFAVWNVPKAIHIMGTYTGKYLWNTLLFLVFAFFNYCITLLLAFVLGLGSVQYSMNIDLFLIIRLLIFFIAQYAIAIYWIYVNAYLLGTIAPTYEA